MRFEKKKKKNIRVGIQGTKNSKIKNKKIKKKTESVRQGLRKLEIQNERERELF